MKMTSSTLFGIVLAVAMFSAGAVVDRVTNVYVTNFPLDAQGNIRVTDANKDVTVTNLPLDARGNVQVVFKVGSLNLSLASERFLGVKSGLTMEANVDGYKMAYIAIYTSNSEIHGSVYWIIGGVTIECNTFQFGPPVDVWWMQSVVMGSTLRISIYNDSSSDTYVSVGLYAIAS